MTMFSIGQEHVVTGSYPQLVKGCLDKRGKALEWGHFLLRKSLKGGFPNWVGKLVY